MALETGTFSADELIHCYSPPNLLSVMPGNRVMLRSGGPEMIVMDNRPDNHALCMWEGDGKLHTAEFDLRCLTCYGAK